MPSIKKTDQTETEIEVTPDYCFGEAARWLSGAHMSMSGGVDYAREWRELGLALMAKPAD